MRLVRAGAVLSLLLGAASPTAAQQLRVDAQAVSVEQRTRFGGQSFRQTGTWLGARGELLAGAWRFGLAGHAGSLGNDPDPANPDLDARTTLVSARRALASWLELGVVAEARRYKSDVATTTWRIYGLSARVETDLGMPTLRGFADLSVFPLAGGTNAVAPASAARGSVGLRLTPPGARTIAELSYRFERFNLDDPAAGRRHAQLEGLTIGAGVRLGR